MRRDSAYPIARYSNIPRLTRAARIRIAAVRSAAVMRSPGGCGPSGATHGKLRAQLRGRKHCVFQTCSLADRAAISENVRLPVGFQSVWGRRSRRRVLRRLGRRENFRVRRFTPPPAPSPQGEGDAVARSHHSLPPLRRKISRRPREVSSWSKWSIAGNEPSKSEATPPVAMVFIGLPYSCLMRRHSPSIISIEPQ